jgi:SAM-dependent methyltransferase
MADPRGGFYVRVLGALLDEGVIRRDMSVLVAAGGNADREAFLALGFGDVTISNLDERESGAGLEPYAWRYEDAESLSLPDASVDVAVVSAGLHHCRSPHRALLELYRVARVAAVALESRDSALMRLGARLGAIDDYELGAVAAHGLAAGGVANTSTPNYVYRWTEREVAKTVASFAPHARHRLRFFREFELPDVLVESARGPRGLALRVLRPTVSLVTRVLPSQSNLFAFAIEKPDPVRDLQPWMASADEPDERVISRRYTIDR